MSPKSTAIVELVIGKTLQRPLLSACTVIGAAFAAYIFIFYEVFFGSQTLFFMLLATTLLISVATSFALEYDTEDELKVLINIGALPSDIFKIGVYRIATLSLMGYLIAVVIAVIIPLAEIKNYLVFYALLLSASLGSMPVVYTSMKSLRLSLLDRKSFNSIEDRDVPVIISPSEISYVAEYFEFKLLSRTDVALVGIKRADGAEPGLKLACRFIGNAGNESMAIMGVAGLSPDQALKDDGTLPKVYAHLKASEAKKASMECWEDRDGRRVDNSYIALNFGSLVRQLLIEYKVAKGKKRSDDFYRE